MENTGHITKDSKTILISGAGGQLGRSFKRVSHQFDGFRYIFLNHLEFDICDRKAIQKHILENNPDYWINCAAYTKVDQAEEEIQQAFDINGYALKSLASLCTEHQIQLIHFSSDYVYHQNPGRPLNEGDLCKPKSQYAISKKLGEDFILNSSASHVIIRTSWLYAPFGQNFVLSILNLMEDKDQLHIVNDQVGAPTYAQDLAFHILQILHDIQENPTLQSRWQGIFNYANKGQTHWFGFAGEILKLLGKSDFPLYPISSKEFGAKAPRPSWSVMSTQKIEDAFHINIPHWKTSLATCIHEIIN